MESPADRPIPTTRADGNKRITVLTEVEKYALYGLPDFDDFQRAEYLAMNEVESALVFNRRDILAQVYCLLQIGYFKAKQAFFRFSLQDVPSEDIAFLMQRYFPGVTLEPRQLPMKEHYIQRNEIVKLFGSRLWSNSDGAVLLDKATQLARRDVTPTFVLTELIVFLNSQKIVRPGYTTLQTVIGDALTFERRRLEQLIDGTLNETTRTDLQKLLVREDTLLGLAALKQDAKHFGYRQMVLERKKLATLEPIYRTAKTILPKLGISLQNMNYYASLANFYTIYDLRRLKPEQTHLYLLCYAWQRCRQLTDNLVDALGYHMKQFEDETKTKANKRRSLEQTRQQQERPQVGRLLLIYVDGEIPNTIPFGDVRQHAFTIMPEDAVRITGRLLSEKPAGRLALRWQIVDELADRVRRHLRPPCMTLNFSSNEPDNPWIAALAWMKGVFPNQQRLSQRPLAECPERTVPKRLRPYLLVFEEDGNATGVHAGRYEFWVYRQLRKRLKSGEIYLDDSMQHRCFNDELVSLEEKAALIDQLDIP